MGKIIMILVVLLYINILFADGLPLKEAKADTIIPISEARKMPEGTTVTVEGICLANSDVLFYVEDNTAGINVYFSSAPQTYLMGDKLKVTGVITIYNGLTEIKPSQDTDVVVISHNNELPKAYQMPYGARLTEDQEGSLIVFGNCKGPISEWQVVEVGSPPALSGAGYSFTGIWGNSSFQVYIYPVTGIDVSKITKGDKIVITGIGGQYDSSEPYTEGYQLLPRFPADIIKLQMDGSAGEVFLKTDKNIFIPSRGEKCIVSVGTPSSYKINLSVYDTRGRKRLDIMQNRSGGLIYYTWDGRDSLARMLPSGIYFIQLKAQDKEGKWETKMQTVAIGTILK